MNRASKFASHADKFPLTNQIEFVRKFIIIIQSGDPIPRRF